MKSRSQNVTKKCEILINTRQTSTSKDVMRCSAEILGRLSLMVQVLFDTLRSCVAFYNPFRVNQGGSRLSVRFLVRTVNESGLCLEIETWLLSFNISCTLNPENPTFTAGIWRLGAS